MGKIILKNYTASLKGIDPYIFSCSVFSIVNEEPNAEEMKSRVKAYEEANRSQIVIRQSQRADEERCTADRYVHLCFRVCIDAS